jgi:hypothetical protein
MQYLNYVPTIFYKLKIKVKLNQQIEILSQFYRPIFVIVKIILP